MGRFQMKDRTSLEKLLQMEGGYVSDFSNSTFQRFIAEKINVDIYDEKYAINGDSKAKRLRCFWDIESDYLVKKLLNELINHQFEIEEDILQWDSEHVVDNNLYERCRRIVASIDDSDALDTLKELDECKIDDSSVELLKKNIRECIENQEPELALDRLHTFCVKYIRELCDKHRIEYDRNKPLHSCYGEYIKYLEKNELLESEMTKKIMKFSISILDSFNHVRNNQSYAHDNKILNYEESMLIFRTVSSVLTFIDAVERNRKLDNPSSIFTNDVILDFPF